MISGLARVFDAVLGRGESAITVPALDGALRPNRKLDEAWERVAIDCPSGIISCPGGVLVSNANQIHRLDAGGAWTLFHQADGSITCLGDAGDGIAIGFENGDVEMVGGRFDGVKFEAVSGARCPTAIAGAEDGLFVCHGSSSNPPSAWQRDLLERNGSGSVWLLDPTSGDRHRLANRLAFPAGIIVNQEMLVVSESWKNRIVRLDRQTGKLIDAPLGDLPGYPGQISRDGERGYFLSVFAPRSQLLEFILREPGYKRHMLSEIDPRYWVAPTYRAGRSFYEPMQGGGVKQLGILKPWAPTLSFGMVVHMDENCLPLESFQSRADGSTHGVVGAALVGDNLYVASRGNNVIARLDVASTDRLGAP
jgi:hypothetical protein